jgi:hypothetical protein
MLSFYSRPFVSIRGWFFVVFGCGYAALSSLFLFTLRSWFLLFALTLRLNRGLV